jgi:hypothetical protein
MSLLLLKRETGGPGTRVRPADERRAGRGGRRIRCPRCGWEPRPGDRWGCLCGHVWNTFETEGVCPGCGRAWEETQCHRCHAWSLHRDWYVTEEETG